MITPPKPFTNPLLLSLLMGIPFVVLFVIARNLPVEPCEFLHEETYNEEGELDYCGADETGFVDLSTRKWPMKIDFRPIGSLEMNQECKFEFKIEKADGSPLTSQDVALSHTQKIHLLAVDKTLNDYHHIHPVADSLFDGVWHFSLTPKLAGKYSVFLDFIPQKSPRRVLISSSFEVVGKSQSPVKREECLVFSKENFDFELIKIPAEPGQDQIQLRLLARDKKGLDITLHPVMGAFAHMVAFDKNVNGFAHLHPLNEDLDNVNKTTFQGPLTFGFSPPGEGVYRLWAQVRTDIEEEVFIPFDLKIGS